jgi:hypothetical protein
MSARGTVDDDDQWVPFLEVYRDHPRRPRGRLAGMFTKPVVKAVAILFAVVFFSLSIYLVCVLMVGSASLLSLADVFAAAGESTIEGNIPEPQDFDRLLKSNLEAYFAQPTGKRVTVTYELLRQGPSQAGTAYPKYYAWVDVLEGTKRIQSGVVRVAAIDKAYFEVTNYYTVGDIRRDPAHVQWVFGDDSYQKIRRRMIQESPYLTPSAPWIQPSRGREVSTQSRMTR